MTSINVQGLSVRFPVFGVDSRSLKKHIARLTIGGKLYRGTGNQTIVTALTNVNLSLKAGDRLGLIGPNGSGKTTLLRVLAGAYAPDEGMVEINGRVSALLDLGIGIDPSATGFENIQLRGQIAGMSRKELADRADEIAAFSGLGHFLAMPVKTYSAGMQLRLAFAAATAVNADVILMDEWIATGDAEFAAIANARLEERVAEAGILVLASHNLGAIRAYCNKVMRISGGSASPVVPIDQLDELLQAA